MVKPTVLKKGPEIDPTIRQSERRGVRFSECAMREAGVPILLDDCRVPMRPTLLFFPMIALGLQPVSADDFAFPEPDQIVETGTYQGFSARIVEKESGKEITLDRRIIKSNTKWDKVVYYRVRLHTRDKKVRARLCSQRKDCSLEFPVEDAHLLHPTGQHHRLEVPADSPYRKGGPMTAGSLGRPSPLLPGATTQTEARPATLVIRTKKRGQVGYLDLFFLVPNRANPAEYVLRLGGSYLVEAENPYLP